MMRWTLLFVLISLSFSASGQQKIWVFFTDKGDLSAYEVQDLLTAEALANRSRQGLGIDDRDFPVNRQYLESVVGQGAILRQRSRWLNAISVEASPEILNRITSLPFVQEIRPVASLRKPAPVLSGNCDTMAYLGTAYRQLGMLGLDDLHGAGFRGEGVRIAVFDNGFVGVDSLPGFEHLFEEGRLLGQWDFVDSRSEVFETCIHCKHGTYVFSLMAANMPGRLMGGAPGASYMLFRTEDDYGETHQEEDNWVAAAEMADSLGAQIFTTSLGYFDFDEGEGDYTRDSLDGNTTIITRAADLAASRGILVVNSAGNNGFNHLVAPADGDSVLAVGSVNECEEVSGFSSRGPTADGRIKPDLVAMGEGAYVLQPDGTVRQGNGTSFSCPLMTSLAACLLQRYPYLSAWELHQVLIASGDRALTPDMNYGHGLPHARRVEALLQDGFLPASAFQPLRSGDLLVYPNPAEQFLRIAWIYPVSPSTYEVSLNDLAGRRVMVETHAFSDREWQVTLPLELIPGTYLLQLQHSEFSDVRHFRKVVIAER